MVAWSGKSPVRLPSGRWELTNDAQAIAGAAFNCLYNLFLHPLRDFPGPKFWGASHLPYTISWLSGHAGSDIARLHDQYGDVVRVAPHRLSFTHPEAWNEIRGHRKAGEGENGKDPHFYNFSQKNLLGSNRENHSRYRRALASGFSAKSIQGQQPLIREYVDLLINQLRALTTTETKERTPRVVDMVAWFNFTTFDVIGDLAFGEPFGCLADSKYHPWVSIIFAAVSQFHTIMAIRWHAPFLLYLMRTLMGSKLGRPQQLQTEYATKKLDKRLAIQTDRPDFVRSMIGAETESGEKMMTREEMVQNARLLVIAGSETTATALSATAFFLIVHRDVQKKLADEVRSSFQTEEEIDLFSVQKLKYMLAVLNESMRVMPPVPGSFPRVCQPGGDTICGRRVPGGTGLDIWPPAVFRSARNFVDPDSFIPERWFDDGVRDERFRRDRQDAFQPFSVGPRNCIGKNLAFVEMRLILARLIWNFDLEPADDGVKNWLNECGNFHLWLKGPLNVRLTPVHSS
ncbi:cytochrome P450 [Lasiosphaeris hirsuta]|uniref:Cytochrome P450 n=1 Tax=Lasiosphaeris hirsuta TaxID=260670 RepID=A0AA40A281_9PEZI|nr:cytochrome P450 [Lasiosphaeris hirsuta]